jgi:hypothetical protein
MLKPKTHFEQVPLEIVRKIVEEQIRRETAREQAQGTQKDKIAMKVDTQAMAHDSSDQSERLVMADAASTLRIVQREKLSFPDGINLEHIDTPLSNTV